MIEQEHKKRRDVACYIQIIGEKMNYKYITKFKVIKKVYQIIKRTGLLSLLTGEKQETDLNLVGITTTLFEHDVVNEFCQTVTGSDEDFEEKEIDELESVILGFFECTKESWSRLKLAGMLGDGSLETRAES